MYKVLATAAAGLNAGGALHAALAGAPAQGDIVAAAAYHQRTRWLGAALSAASAGAAAAAHLAEAQGELWLGAAAAAGLGVPYSLMLMGQPSAPAGDAAADLEPRVSFAAVAENAAGGAEPRARSPRLSRLKSGLLLSPHAYVSSWSRRHWFSAALSGAAFGRMLGLLVTRRGRAAYAAPF
jgi:hypothetical protein